MKMVSSKFRDEKLDEMSLKIVKQSIGETPESRSEGLWKLKSKLKSTENLQPRMDDEFLLRFLRVAKFNVVKAYGRMIKFYQIRRKYSHIFQACCPSSTTAAQTVRHFHASPIRSNDHSAVVIHKKGLYDPSITPFEEIFILDLLILDHLQKNPLAQLCGLTIILDYAGYSYQQLFQENPKRLRMAVESFQKAFPVRFKSIHVINAPQIFSLVYNLSYPFLTKKMKDRLHIHRSSESFLSSLSPEVVPEEYGGKISQSDLIDLVEEVIHEEDYFKEQLQYGYLE